MSSADKWHCLLIFDVDQVLSFDAEIRRGNFWMQVRMLKYFFQNLCICVRLYARIRYVHWTRFHIPYRSLQDTHIFKLYERGDWGAVW